MNYRNGFLILLLIMCMFILISCDKVFDVLVPPKAEDFYSKGLTEERSENFEKALEYYNSALKLEPENLTYLKRKAIILTNLMRYSEAIECNEQILKVQPDSAGVIFNNVVLYDKTDDTKKSLQYIDRLLKKNPEDFQALSYKGYIYYRQNRKKEGLNLIKYTLKGNPDKKDLILKNLEINLLINPGKNITKEYPLNIDLAKFYTYSGYKLKSIKKSDKFTYKTIGFTIIERKHLTSWERSDLEERAYNYATDKYGKRYKKGGIRDEKAKKILDDDETLGDKIHSVNYLLQANKNIPPGIYYIAAEYTITTLYSGDTGQTTSYGVVPETRTEERIIQVGLKILVL